MFKSVLTVLAFSVLVSAQYSVNKTPGGSTVYDYQNKSYLSSTKSGNVTSTYDYKTKSYSTSIRSASGITSTYDYGTKSYSTTTKKPDGYSTYDYGTRKNTEARATGNNSYTINSDNERDRKSSLVGILGSR
jgi:hypothetical protein